MTGCSALGCWNTSAKGYIMKTFPRDEARRKLWAANMGRSNWKPTNRSALCEIHFEKHMWEKVRVDGQKKLKHDAVPTIFFYNKLSREIVKDPLENHNSTPFLKSGSTSTYVDDEARASSSSSTLSAEETNNVTKMPLFALPAKETKYITEKPPCAKRTHPLKNSSPKKPKTEPTTEVSDDLKVVVIPKGYPEVKLIKDQHELVKNYILNKIREELDSQNTIKGPQFNECHCESGAFVLNCANSFTKIWLQSLVPLMVRWEGAALIIMDYRDYQNLLRRAKVRLCITGPMKKCSTVEILEVLNHQNEDLCVEEWKVVERSVHERYTSLTMNIDERSWNKLQENNLKAYLGLGQVFFTVLAKPMRKD